jgi:hypothetical protein
MAKAGKSPEYKHYEAFATTPLPQPTAFPCERRVLQAGRHFIRTCEREMQDTTADLLAEKIDLLIRAVERLAPPPVPRTDLSIADCFVWEADPGHLEPVEKVNRVDIDLIRGVERVRDILLDNTERFTSGLPANNALLWGARGMGKSSLVKAVHASINEARSSSGSIASL